MKRYLSIFLIACLLTGCVNGKPRPLIRRNYDGKYPAVKQALQGVVDNTIGKTTFYKKRVIKKVMIPFYDDVLKGRAPYLVEDDGDALRECRTTTMDTAPDLSFAFYDHEAFDYPLLIMRNRVEDYYIFCIIQFFPDGSYATFNTLQPSAQSLLSTGLFTDGNGQLYIDDAYSGALYELNLVDGVLKVNYGYSDHGKGFATLHVWDFSKDEGMSYPSEHYPDGSDVFTKIAIVDDTKEPFDEVDLEALKGDLSEIDVLDFNEENFREIASRYAGGAPKRSETDKAGNHEKSRQFVKSEKGEGKEAESISVALIIEGKNAGSVDALRKDGTTYYPVGEMNRLLVENYKLEDVSEEDRQLFFEDTTTYCMKDETSNAWFFLAWPGAGCELYEGYYLDKNIIIDQFDDYDAPGTYEYMQPKHKPIEEGKELYMDAETLKANFPMDYEESRGVIKIKEVYGNRGDAWKTIKTSPEMEVHTIVEDKL